MIITPEAYKPRILVIDDEPFFLHLITELLKDKYNVSLAKSGKQGLKRVQGKNKPDLILLDVVMPELDGYETCQLMKKTPITHEIPIIFLTAKHEADDEIKGFKVGAVDYITKPINPPVLLSRVRTQLALAKQRIALEGLVEERTKEIERTKDAIVFSMGSMAEARDNETGMHLLRTSAYVRVLAEQLSKTEQYKHILSKRLIDLMQRAAPLHDVGKIGISDAVLQKKGKFNADERIIMNTHASLGKAIIQQAEDSIGTTPFIKEAINIAYCHHEKWDGSGYPQGLKGDAIPLSARLMAVADVYDALISKRCYKDAFTDEQTKEIIMEGKGKHFDPDIVDAFEQVLDDFQSIAKKYSHE